VTTNKYSYTYCVTVLLPRRVTASVRFLGLGFESRQGHGFRFLESVLCFQVERSLRQADHSSRGVLASVVCLSVIGILNNEAPWPSRGCRAMVTVLPEICRFRTLRAIFRLCIKAYIGSKSVNVPIN